MLKRNSFLSNRHRNRTKFASNRSRRRLLQCEGLEQRVVLTSYIVDTLDDTGASDGMVSLREAIIAANTNAAFGDAAAGEAGPAVVDSIEFSPSLNGQVIALGSLGTLQITDSLQIADTNTQPLLIDGAGQQIFEITGSDTSATISNLIIAGGEGSTGGAFYVGPGASLSLAGATVQNNRADDGGGVYNDGGTISILDSTFTNNFAAGASGSGAAIFSTSGTVAVVSSDLTFNYANRAGGAVEIVDGTFTALRSRFVRNDVSGTAGAPNPGNGGALHVTGSAAITVASSVLTGNTAGSEGGALWNQAGSTMTVINSLIDSNEAFGDDATNGGGGIFNNGGIVNVLGAETTISNNFASGLAGSGGGIFNDAGGTFNVTDATITGNEAVRAGGGIEAVAATTTNLTNVMLTSNFVGSAPGNGGGFHITGAGDATITGGEVSDNVAAREGGGLWNGSGTMTIDGTLITRNEATGAAADDGGGGVFNNGGTLNITGATISDNLATGVSGSGGGLFSLGGPVTVTDSTLSFNSANRAGGGIEIVDGSLTMTNSNLINNDVDGGAGVANPGNGGGLHVTGNATTITIDGGSVFSNFAGSEGGGLWNQAGSTLTVQNGTLIDSNEAFGDDATNGGGGIFNNGGIVNVLGAETTISNNFASGLAGSGGGIFNDAGGTVSVTDATITGNEAVRAGGGIEAVAGTTTNLTDVMLTSNFVGASPGNGGGLHITGAGDATITGGEVSDNVAAREGGGLWNGGGTMTIDGTLITRNEATGDAADDGGGGVFNNGGALNITGATISENLATGTSGSGGGLLSLSGPVTIANSTFTNNSANRAGGGIEAIDGLLAITATTFTANDVDGSAGTANPGNGGGIHTSGAADVDIVGGAFVDNQAGREGGGVWIQAGGTLTTSGGLFFANNAAHGDAADDGGGALFNNGGTILLEDTSIFANTADGASGSGGGILNLGGSVIATRVFIGTNTANRAGGGIEDNAGELQLIDSTLTSNEVFTSPGNGGGLHITGGSQVDILDSVVSFNTAGAEGGGLWNSAAGTLSVTRTTVEGNSAPTGGGVFNDGASGDIIITASTIARNQATGAGGGLISEGGTVNIVNSTISTNTADTGGGVSVLGGTVNMTSVTVGGNLAAVAAGGVDILAGSATALNTIVAANVAPASPDVSGTLDSGGNNLIGNTSGATISGTATGNVTDVNAMLGPLASNGGPTQTHALLTGSPAIDAGAAAIPSVDQRGVGRPQGAASDIGAFEAEVADGGALFARADVSGDGFISPMDVLLVVNDLNSAAEGEASPSRRDVNGDGFVSPIDALIIVNLLNQSQDETSESPVPSETVDQADSAVDAQRLAQMQAAVAESLAELEKRSGGDLGIDDQFEDLVDQLAQHKLRFDA